jgi:hypothetical protein
MNSKEENIKIIVEELNRIVSNAKLKFTQEDYGIEPNDIKKFQRRYELFNFYLAEDIYGAISGEYFWLLERKKESFVDLILIDGLCNFFFDVFGKEYEPEDFQRNGIEDVWLYFVRDLYGKKLGLVYDELKNK